MALLKAVLVSTFLFSTSFIAHAAPNPPDGWNGDWGDDGNWGDKDGNWEGGWGSKNGSGNGMFWMFGGDVCSNLDNDATAT